MFRFESIKNTKPLYLASIFSLCVIGLVTVFSTTYSRELGISELFTNHIIFYFVGFIIFIFLSAINPYKLKSFPITLVIIASTIMSLFLVLILGTEVYGAQRWINLGPFSFQPSELAKISIIIVTAYCFSIKQSNDNFKLFNIYKTEKQEFSLKEFLLSEIFIKKSIAVLFFILTILLIIKQKSLGNSILITLIFLSILFINIKVKFSNLLLIIPLIMGASLGFNIPDLQNLNIFFGINLGISVPALIIYLGLILLLVSRLKLNIIPFLIIFIAGLFIQPVLYFGYNNILEPYQRQRIESFLGISNSSNISLNEDFNRQMSIIAVGSGQVFGKGLLNGNIVNSRLLPFAYTDFAFAGFSEQFGFAGSLIIIILILSIIIYIFNTFSKTEDLFLRLICIGVISLIFFNSFQHIAMNMGLTPITGVPLPLVSYGGSAIISTFIGLGLVNAISIQKEEDIEVLNLKKDFDL